MGILAVTLGRGVIGKLVFQCSTVFLYRLKAVHPSGGITIERECLYVVTQHRAVHIVFVHTGALTHWLCLCIDINPICYFNVNMQLY